MALDSSWAGPPMAPRTQGLATVDNENIASTSVNRHPDSTNASNEGGPAPGPVLETRPLVIGDGEHVSASFYGLRES